MRFHHSTRRGRHHLTTGGSHAHNAHNHLSLASAATNSSRWCQQLSHCRETNIHFHRRLPVEYHQASASKELSSVSDTLLSIDYDQNGNNKLSNGNSLVAQQSRRTSAEVNPESIREKLIGQVQKHPFWSNKAAKRMQITNVSRRNVYIYELESYCERRDLEWDFEPYRGCSISPYKMAATYRDDSPRPGGSLSQPATPLNHAGSHANDSLWLAEDGSPPRADLRSSAAVARTLSSPSSQVTPAPTLAGGSRLKFEPKVSARLEHLIPSADYVWSTDVSAGAGVLQPRGSSRSGRQTTATTSPGCVSIELPNSSFVKRCHGCQGRGKLKCSTCHGVGYEVCLSCSGRGSTRSYSTTASASQSGASSSMRGGDRGYVERAEYSNDSTSSGNRRYAQHSSGNASVLGSLGVWNTESCATCHGAGQKRCWACAGRGFNNCPACAGAINLRCFLTLTVSWISHRDNVIINNSDQIIPKERLRVCSGLLLVDQIEDRLGPLELDLSVGVAGAENGCDANCTANKEAQCDSWRAEAEQLQVVSKQLLEKHRHAYRSEKLLKQRHKVTKIECHVVSYEWKQRRGQFVIYGEERKVYIGKYPFKSLCNII